MRIVRHIDLRGKIVTGDAEFAQRHLSAWIVGSGEETLSGTVKDQPGQLHHDNREPCLLLTSGCQASVRANWTFRTAEKWNKAHAGSSAGR